MQEEKQTNNEEKDVKITQKKKNRQTKQAVTLGSVTVKQKHDTPERPGLFLFTLIVIYKNLYILGIKIIRLKRQYLKRLRKFFILKKGSAYAFLDMVKKQIVSLWKAFCTIMKAPFLRIRSTNAIQKKYIIAAKEQGKIPLTPYLKIIGSFLALVWKIITTALNHLAPIAAVVVMLYTINLYVSQPLGLEVIYNNKSIGYIDSEADFDKAMTIMRERFMDESLINVAKSVPKFNLVAVESDDNNLLVRFVEGLRSGIISKDDFITSDQLADKMVQASGGEIEQAYGLYINDQFYGAVKDKNYVPAELDRIKTSNMKGSPDERVEFLKRITYKEGLYPSNSVVDIEQIDSVINSYETVDQVYIVQKGDSPTLIASKNGIPYSLLREYNPNIEDELKIGQEVMISKARPFLSVKNIYTSIYQEPEPFEVEEIKTATFTTGHREITQEGVDGVSEVKAEITAINGIETERNVLEKIMLLEAIPQKVIVGTKDPKTITSLPGTTKPPDMTGSPATASSGFIWPTLGGYINGGIGSYPGHTGVDIPRPSGTPIYASASGTVVLVKSSYINYGLHLVIDHGNGYQTWYAHASSIYVSVGDTVTQGQVIAAVGRTGRATGNHLHFEVRYNGKIMIPQNYIGG